MRSLIILLVTFWLPAAFAHHHHGISLDPASSFATPHVAVAGEARMTAAPVQSATAVQATAATSAPHGNEHLSGDVLPALLLLVAAWGLWRLARR